MIKYFENVNDVKKILSCNGAKLVVLLVARYSDGKEIYNNIDVESLNDLCGEKIVFGMPAWAKKGKETILEEPNCSKALITDIMNELNIREKKVPCLYLYDICNKLDKVVSINNNANIYNLIKKIVINCDKYLIERKKQKNFAKGIDILADRLEERENLIVTFFSKTDNIIKTITLATSIYTFASIIINMMYKLDCEKFYNIPSKYFNTGYSNKIIILVCLLLLFSTPIICFCGKRYLIKDGATKFEVIILTTLCSIYISICMGMLNIFNLEFIIEWVEDSIHIPTPIADFINKYANVIVWGVMILGMLSAVAIVLFDNIDKIKRKTFRFILQIISWISVTFTIVLFVLGIGFKMTSSVQDLKKYEVISYSDSQYIVLSNCDDKALVVPFDVDEDDQYTFYTSKYKFVDKYEGNFEYIIMQHKPLISEGIQ